MAKNPPTLADACVASMLDKRWYGQQTKQHVAIRRVLREVAEARKFVLDASMSRFLAELSDGFWRGGLRKRLRMLDNARLLARAPHALTWIEYSYHADYLARIKELKSQGVVDWTGNNPQRMGWLIRQHPRNEASFAVVEIRASVNIAGFVIVHPLAATWCADDNPSPWKRFPPPELDFDLSGHLASEAVVEMQGYRSTQVHWYAYLGDDVTIAILNDLATQFAHSDDQLSVAMKPAVALRALWALLATINDLPVIIEHVEPSKGFVARGSYKKFLKHSIVHLTVPVSRWYKLSTKISAILRRRAHQVRGHWRIDWHARPIKTCEHEWNADMTCRKCGGRKLWIAEHQRGDASLGFVTHDYDVTHEVG